MDLKKNIEEAKFATARAAGWTIITVMVTVGTAKQIVRNTNEAIQDKIFPASKRRTTYVKL